ncbi:DNA-nicking endonuclease, Smr domain [Cohaesibacter sp. ES.047]|uniref:Smr/MutS family protein n=1 Tax=Cohaesibacter sp. ES.047 TaxID=1798205 RepID=UPI000BBFFE87|nr:Smr/MutS family protein [Cohaesibacter sp. ES.047]SNY90509.1 DNA-nicking endonuclease, Smr domain [Cohaesibacter sp. ES.047]
MARKPPLSRKDLKLWHKVTQSITPMQGKSAELKALIETIETKQAKPGESAHDPQHPVQRKKANAQELKALQERGMAGSDTKRASSAMPLGAIDRKEKKRIVKGRSAIDARLDLHGMTQREAHDSLFGFLRSCHAKGAKHVLVITGKGSRGDEVAYSIGREKGVLRRVVPQWLSEPAIRSIIVGFEEAHPILGGAGALHIRLRKRNKSSG